VSVGTSRSKNTTQRTNSGAGRGCSQAGGKEEPAASRRRRGRDGG